MPEFRVEPDNAVGEFSIIKKIPAIKFIRKATGLGLVDSKAIVEIAEKNPLGITLTSLGDVLEEIRNSDVVTYNGHLYKRVGK
jgi:hypothetical protein